MGLLTEDRDAIQYAHDQTVRFINKGYNPDDIAARLRLPKIYIITRTFKNFTEMLLSAPSPCL